MSFLWNLYQDRQIQNNRQEVSDALRDVNSKAGREVDRLRDRVDSLTLTNIALWTLMRDKLGLTDGQLEQRVRELDLADGVADGKMGVGPWQCSACQRPNSPRHKQCLYCGVENAKAIPFPVE